MAQGGTGSMTAELRAGHRSRESSRVTETRRWQRSEGWAEAVQTQRLLRVSQGPLLG